MTSLTLERAQQYLESLTSDELMRLVAEGGYGINRIGQVLRNRLTPPHDR